MSQPPGWSAPDAPQGAPEGQQGQQQPSWGAPAANGWGAPAPGNGWGAPQRPAYPPPPTRPRPGIIPLRPLGLGDLYDGAFRAIRTNPKTMIGISAVVITVTAVITTVPQAAALISFGTGDLMDPERADDLSPGEVASSFAGLFSSLLVPALIQALAVTVVSGLLIVAVSNAVLGRKTAPGPLWARSRRRVPALIGLALFLIAFNVLVTAALVAPGVLLLLADQIVAGVVALLVGLLLGLAVYLVLGYGFWSLAAPAMMLEDLSVGAALRRSWQLVRPSFWRVVGIMLLTTLLVGVLSGFLTVPFSLVSTFVGLLQDPPYSSFPLTLLQLGVAQIGSILAGAVLYPLSAAVTALLYIDLRMRQEGLDVELMRAAESPAE